MRRSRKVLLALVLFTAVLGGSARAHAEAGDELTVSVLTFGPGDHPFFKFGHNAIWVHDAARGRDLVYNFGTFGFESPWLIADFLKGHLRYWLSVQSLRATLAEYRYENRTVEAQELELTPAERLRLAQALAENALEENKHYRYDYYLDNCSTRVRDAIDRVLDGRLHAAAREPASMTWRDHTRRLTANELWEYVGLNVGLADFVDRPIDLWQEMFIPAKVQEALRRVTVPGPDGERPLVRSERVLFQAAREPPPGAPPGWKIPMALAGAMVGGLLFALGALARRAALARWALAAAYAVLGLVIGVLGSSLIFLWGFTDHRVAYHNENILQLAPWALALVVVAPRAARGRAQAQLWLARLLVAAAAASLIGLVLKVLPWLDQVNGEIIALLLPLWLGAAAGALAWTRAWDWLPWRKRASLGGATLPGSEPS